jgi:energy-coupling factor transport system ATP-binding protein
MALVEINSFSYTYPGEQAPSLSEVDLCIEKGDIVVLAGPSGSGKSTLGKAMAGFLFQDEEPNFSGSVFVNHKNMSEIPLFQASERVAYVQQNPEDQFCTLTVLDEVAFGLENACIGPAEIERRIDQALHVVQGMPLRNRSLATLSGGEKQKIAIASMLALEPDVLILDEPTSNLDPEATLHIFQTLAAIREQKALTIVIIEHKLHQLIKLDPKLILINDGKIINQTRLSAYQQSSNIQNLTYRLPIKQIGEQSSQPVVKVDYLTVNLDGEKILRDLSFEILPGEFIAIMGPNGSGKSTLLQTLMGFHKISAGSVCWFGEARKGLKTSELVPKTGFIFQNPDHQLFTHSVWDEATLTMKNLGLMSTDYQQKAREILKHLGLEDRINDHPQRLSYGEKRRLNLAAEILHHPRHLLVDELLIGQDSENADCAMQILKSLASDGCAVLLVNHHADLTRAHCDRILFMDDGAIVIDKSTQDAFVEMGERGYSCFMPEGQERFANA